MSGQTTAEGTQDPWKWNPADTDGTFQQSRGQCGAHRGKKFRRPLTADDSAVQHASNDEILHGILSIEKYNLEDNPLMIASLGAFAVQRNGKLAEPHER